LLINGGHEFNIPLNVLATLVFFIFFIATNFLFKFLFISSNSSKSTSLNLYDYISFILSCVYLIWFHNCVIHLNSTFILSNTFLQPLVELSSSKPLAYICNLCNSVVKFSNFNDYVSNVLNELSVPVSYWY